MTPGVATRDASAGGAFRDLSKGAVLQCVEAATLGMPFEVWKTRMGRYRSESTVEAFQQIYREGGVRAYWRGLAPKLVESASKGAVLLYSKECILTWTRRLGASDTLSGFAAGAGGGICQTVVMGPCTYIVTALVTQDKSRGLSVSDKVREVLKTSGLKGFYSGGTAVAFRQATNWASRQGFTEWIRTKMKRGDEEAKLSSLVLSLRRFSVALLLSFLSTPLLSNVSVCPLRLLHLCFLRLPFRCMSRAAHWRRGISRSRSREFRCSLMLQRPVLLLPFTTKSSSTGTAAVSGELLSNRERVFSFSVLFSPGLQDHIS